MRAFWISEKNEIIPVKEHIDIIQPFPRSNADHDNEMLKLMKSGWLRARRYKNHWSLEGAWARAGKAEAFKKAIVTDEPDRFVDLHISQIQRNGKEFEAMFRTSLARI